MAARPNVQAADVAARMACKANVEPIPTTQPMMSFAAKPLERQLAGSRRVQHVATPAGQPSGGHRQPGHPASPTLSRPAHRQSVM